MHGLGMKEIGLLLIGVLLGAITAAGLYSGGERYDLIASPDGSVVHKIDRRTGDVWIKNSYVEVDPAGQPVTIWYWEKLTLDKPGAKSIAQNLQENADQVREEAEAARRAEVERIAGLRSARLDEIHASCGEDTDCVADNCTIGPRGLPEDPAWPEYCAETLKARIFDLVISQCKGSASCIKAYCINKFDNTYPAVSDCISEINLRKVQAEAASQ